MMMMIDTGSERFWPNYLRRMYAASISVPAKAATYTYMRLAGRPTCTRPAEVARGLASFSSRSRTAHERAAFS
ncbi:hypothetical protein EVAR_27726_1 [Eumeta japonica]|uniref:Uncharacterized protein n=1 Tax=Eumeta variegata TaxID=151549 RepID=A0A4C1WND0_EUMVA|nr:hypothetical protein EVAR_27726_1 [Eumeta japonica]